MYQYRAKIIKVLDGDTVEIDLDLGFNIVLANQKVRLAGVDTPESRTSNLEEKPRGLLSKKKLQEMMKKFIAMILISVCGAVQAQTAHLPVECGSLKDLSAVLAEYEEKPFATGETTRLIRGDKKVHVVLFFLNAKTGTWSVAEKVSDDIYCILSGGTNFFLISDKKI